MGTTMRTHALLLATTLLFWSSACGKKDEPAPTPAPATTAAPPTAPPPTAPATSAPPAGVVNDKQPEPSAKVELPPAAMTPVPAQAALLSSTLATFPADIVAVGGLQNPRALMDAFLAQAKRVPGLTQTADPLDFLLAHVKEAFGAKDLSWLALDRPVRFAVPNPKKYPHGFIQIYSLVPGTKLEPTAFANAKAKDEGHWASLPTSADEKVFIDLDGELMTITSHAALTKDLGPFIKELSAWTPGSPVVVEASATNARTAFASELSELQGNIDGLTKQLGDAGAKPEQLAMLKNVADGAFGMLTGLDRLGLALDPSGGFPRLALSFRAIAGTPFAATAQALQSARPTFASLVPDQAWFALVYDFDFTDLLGGKDMLAEALAHQSTLSEADAKTVSALAGKMQELGTGNHALWLTTSGSFPIAIESVSSASDGPALKDAMLGLFDFLFKQRWGHTREGLIAGGMSADALPGLEFADFISKAGTMTRAFGVVPSLPKTDGASVLALDFDWSRLGAGRIPAAMHDALVGFVGRHLELAVAAAPSRVSFAFGPFAGARTAELVAMSSDAQVKDPWLAQAAADSFGVLELRPVRLVRALASLPQVAQARDAIAKLPDDPLLISGSSDGTAVNVTITLPIDMLLGLFSSF